VLSRNELDFLTTAYMTSQPDSHIRELCYKLAERIAECVYLLLISFSCLIVCRMSFCMEDLADICGDYEDRYTDVIQRYDDDAWFRLTYFEFPEPNMRSLCCKNHPCSQSNTMFLAFYLFLVCVLIRFWNFCLMNIVIFAV